MEFDKFLKEEKLEFEAVVIGGAALIILEVIERATKDVDCLFPQIPPEIKEASKKFAKKAGKHFNLYENWLNNGPESLIRDLPPDWQNRLQKLYNGKALKLKTLGRDDLLKSKLFAYCDRQDDFEDCVKLAPNVKELRNALKWVQQRDGNPQWPAHCEISFQELAQRLGYEW